MSDRQTWSERSAEADAARANAKWGMRYLPDDREAPERLAYDAAQRGDTWFSVDVPIAWYQGNVAMGPSYTRVHRPEPYDHIGAIERQGWSLHSVSAYYVPRGGSHGGYAGAPEESTHGDAMALLVFRRRPAPAG